jgi:protease-4
MAPAGTVGGLSTANLIRKARDDKDIKAVLLRVDSPGGSVFGSELVRRELELTRAAGKPVVVSMGNVAASGGYWISTASDEIVADAGTITGSIGVFALLPSADQTLAKLGVHPGGVGTTWLRNADDPRLPLDPRLAQLVQTSVDHIYLDFTTKVAAARKTTPEKIDAVAQGRVWTGLQAKERGLVDTIGQLGDAVRSASARAKLGDKPRVVYIERDPGKFAQLLDMLNARISALAGASIDERLGALGVAPSLVRDVGRDLGWVAEIVDRRKPFAAVVHCLCGELR